MQHLLPCVLLPVFCQKRKLIELDIDADWQVEGLMDSVHTDNGPDFRTNHISRACLKYGIHWEFRPIGGARFGGHIERLIGVVNLEMHILDGTTFSNIQERGSYDSAGHACMTLKELEYYIVYWITKVYHQKKHSKLGMSPLQKWQDGVWGTKTTVGTGLKERVSDEDTLFIDFLPEFESTIQRVGVQKDNLFYFADCLRQWVNCIDSADINKKRKRNFCLNVIQGIFLLFGFMNLCPIHILKYLLLNEKCHQLAYLNTNKYRNIFVVNNRIIKIRMRFIKQFFIYVSN